MVCYNCGNALSVGDVCLSCGADVRTYKKILKLSNSYYNDGLRKAQVRDLSGATASLRQSLKCNKYNIEARNLLGLVLYEMGEAVDAVSEWIISKNFQPENNIVDGYLEVIQANPTKWDNIRQSIRKYNQALDYCWQDSLDLAVIQLKSLLKMNPHMVKGYQLLALIHIYYEEWDQARRCLIKAAKIDTNNTTTKLYLHEVDGDDALIEPVTEPEDIEQRDDIITYKNGNETIIQPINHPEKIGGKAILNALAGLLVGVAVMFFLVLPPRISAAQEEVKKELLDVTQQLTEKSATVDELNKRADALENENAELLGKVQNLTGGDGYIEACDILMKAAEQYCNSPGDLKNIASELAEIDESFLTGDGSSTAFKSLYQMLYEEASVKASKSYMDDGLESLKDEKFEDAISKLSTACELDSSNVEALYNLAHAYRRADQITKAKETYQLVVDRFPDTEYARNASSYIQDGDDSNLNESLPDENTEEEGESARVTTQIPTEDNEDN